MAWQYYDSLTEGEREIGNKLGRGMAGLDILLEEMIAARLDDNLAAR